jgi:SAM-dependent methyltransferase
VKPLRKSRSIELDDPELDPRLAAAYDDGNRWSADDDFWRGLVDEHPASRVADVGCGTGRLTVGLGLSGHDVTGVDPNPAFLAIAATKKGAERVRWIRGTSADLPSGAFDAALMTSHVAQVFLSDDEWAANLVEIKRALVPDGILGFDTRDPAAKAWETWDTAEGVTQAELPGGSVLYSSIRTTFVDDVAESESTMLIVGRALATDPAEVLPVPGGTWSRARWGYRFRSPELVRRTVEDSGFTIEAMYGGWQREPLGEGAGEIVLVARA